MANARDESLSIQEIAAADPARPVDAAALQRALGLRSAWLAGVVHRHFDRDGDGVVRAADLARGLAEVSGGDEMKRLRFGFDLFDHDGNGLIDRGELERFVGLSLAESGVMMSPERVADLARGVFDDADLDRDGQVTFGEFCAAVGRVQGLRSLTCRASASWASPRPRNDAPDDAATWWSEHGRAAVVTALYALANAAAFTAAFLEYRAAGADGYVQVARGFGRVLDLNLLLLLLPTLRLVVSRLRQTPLSRLIPLDDTLGTHRVMGHVVGWAGLAHGAAHTARYLAHGRAPGVFVTDLAAGTGALLVLVGAVMWACALQVVRRSHRFELFWSTHRAYALWVALALAHTPKAWPWMAPAVVLLGLEHTLRRLRRVRPAKALALDPLASGVTRVTVARPPNFAHRAGDYVYLRVPSLAKGEWHPFTVSSAPQRPDVFTLHVRSLGNWTRALHELAETRARVGARLPLDVEIDGPYGTPSSHIFEARVPVLVAAGIGVTPFAAILESLLLRAKGAWQQTRSVLVERVYFVWVARDAVSFEWFAALLAAVEASPVRAHFELMIYMTAGRSDATGDGLALALDLVYARAGVDPLTGLRARTHLGAPDWDSLLDGVRAAHPGATPEVFFCGPDGLAKAVARAAARARLPFRQEHF
ncbi:MAG: ferric reductase-like transmembrane domain-containing protein [Polyangiales bacterium]